MLPPFLGTALLCGPACVDLARWATTRTRGVNRVGKDRLGQRTPHSWQPCTWSRSVAGAVCSVLVDSEEGLTSVFQACRLGTKSRTHSFSSWKSGRSSQQRWHVSRALGDQEDFNMLKNGQSQNDLGQRKQYQEGSRDLSVARA